MSRLKVWKKKNELFILNYIEEKFIAYIIQRSDLQSLIASYQRSSIISGLIVPTIFFSNQQ